MSKPDPKVAADVPRLPAEAAKKINGLATLVLVLGLLAAGGAAFTDHKRFAFSYLAAFMWLVTIGLGGLFFVLIQHVVRAGWSVAPRRHAEWMTSILPVSAILFVPIALWSKELYEHWMGEHAAHDALIKEKSAYLNPTFFFVRAAIYFVIWGALSYWFSKQSRDQDGNGDVAFTERMQSFSPVSTVLFGLSLTFAAFDWLMSLDPHWYSTIFGVYIFAGAAVSAFSVLALINIRFQGAKLLNSVSTVEHRHDLGKFLFGFIVFYAYIAFSQYFLIWYANIPEETIFYKHRWVGSWQTVSLLLLFGHFVGPFILLLSRHAKRSAPVLGFAAVWMLFMHWIDMYWLVMPTLDHHGAHFSWIDGAALLAMIGVGGFVIAFRATRENIFPIHDPRLAEARRVENL
jgi:hypothetical protein